MTFPTVVVLLSARRHTSVYADFKHLVKAVSITRRVDVGLSPKESNIKTFGVKLSCSCLQNPFLVRLFRANAGKSWRRRQTCRTRPEVPLCVSFKAERLSFAI